MRFDLLSLKLFVTVCEQQSISRTADMERIAASAVSKRISDLEAMVKTPLFLRSARGLDMTPAAHDLLKHARIVLRDLGQLENEMLDHSRGRRGEVRVYACHSPLNYHLPRDLPGFLGLNPAIRLSLNENLSQNVVQAVSENAADIGIFGGETNTSGLHVIPYRSDRLVAMMPAGHPLAALEAIRFADMAQHDIVGPQQGSCVDQLVGRAAALLGQPLRVRIRVDHFEPAAMMVESGLGVALVSEHYTSHRIESGRLVLVPLDEPWAMRQWKICSRDPKALPAPVRLLLDHLGARPQARNHARLLSLPEVSIAGYAPISRPALNALAPGR